MYIARWKRLETLNLVNKYAILVLEENISKLISYLRAVGSALGMFLGSILLDRNKPKIHTFWALDKIE